MTKATHQILIGPYQCGFRPGKSTIDQIFTLRQILKKTNEKQVDTHHLSVDYKAVFDSPIRVRVFAAMSELGITAKLIRLCRVMLISSYSSVKVGSLQLRHRVFCERRYFSKKCPVACVRRRYRHHRAYQARCYCCLYCY